MRFKSLISLLVPLAILAAASPGRATAGQLLRFEYVEYHMGSDVRIVVYAPSRPVAEHAVAAAFERFAALDTCMSDYRPDSELMRCCARAGGPATPISADLSRVLARAQELAAMSQGAFDITCGPLIRIWRAARKSHELPGRDALHKAVAVCGYRNVAFHSKARTLRLVLPGMQLDLGGIGKGYAADCVQAVLRQAGIGRALVEAGGDIVVSGPPPGTRGWRISTPNAASDGAPATLTLANCAISTSGDTEQFVEIGGARYSHIVDPRTGQALTTRFAVTVVGRDGLTTDGLSTAISVLGERDGRALAARFPKTTVYCRSVP